jgi:hypothetical protein
LVILRNDDVSPSSDFKKIDAMYKSFKAAYPNSEIWSCVNIFGFKNDKEAVYPDLPLSQLPLYYFYNVDSILGNPGINLHKIISHGLLHVKHTQLSRQAQEMSIVTSCRALHTDIFCPPFTNYDSITEEICKENGIKITRREQGWKSLESEPFNQEHPFWFYHSWRMSKEEFNDKIRAVSVNH